MATLLPTKFFVPPVAASFVARPRLLERLTEALSHRLTLISAPAGSGKTTMVSAWVQSTRRKGAAIGWLSLDEGDNDPRIFLDYVFACLEEGGIGIEITRIPSVPDGQAHIESALADLIRGILPLKRDVLLILDDYHVIQNRSVHSALAYLVDHAPSNLHLMVLTRADPPLELARLRVAGQLLEVRMEHLRFSTQEACEFLRRTAGMELSDADVAALNERTEGWIAGLQMAAISMRGRDDPAAFVAAFAGSHRFVFDYLLEQVLSRQPPEYRDFLLKTSLLERFSASLCDAVVETNGAARGMLDTLERANLFLTPLDDERGWYRYHHLLTDLLRLMLDQAHPGLAPELHRRACRWFEAQGMLSESLHHALAAGDMQLVAQVVSANVLLLVENDEAVPALRQLESVPADEMSARPWLGIAHAWALGAAQVQSSQQILDAVEKSIRDLPPGDEHRRLEGHLAAARAYVCSVQGDEANTVAQAKQAEDLLPRDELAVRAMNLTIWGDVRSDDRRHDPGAMPLLEQALAMALQASKPHVAMIAMGAMASAYLHLGKLHEMHRVCREALEIADEYEKYHHHPLSAKANVLSLLARVQAEWGDNEQAIHFARQGVVLSERWGQADTELICLNYLGRALALANNLEQARQVFEQACAAAQKISRFYYEMTIAFTLESLLDSDLADPAEVAELRRLVFESGVRHTHLLTGRLMLRDNRPEAALSELEQAYEELGSRPSFDIARIYALRALAYQQLGNEKSALAALRLALDLGGPEDRVATFVREGPGMERLLRLARTRAVAPAFVQRLLAAFEARHAHPPQPAPAAEPLIETLSEREFEVLQHLNGPLSTPEIAEQLVVSTNTVRTHIKSIYGKLGAHGRSAAVRRARELSLLN